MKACFAALVFVLAMPTTARLAEDAIQISVTPRTCVAPCAARLSVNVPVATSNRSVTITAESLEFYRSSTRQLEGDEGPRHHELMLEALPAGEYEIRVTVDRTPQTDAERTTTFRVHGDSASMAREKP